MLACLSLPCSQIQSVSNSDELALTFPINIYSSEESSSPAKKSKSEGKLQLEISIVCDSSKTIFMLNIFEREIFNLHKYENTHTCTNK